MVLVVLQAQSSVQMGTLLPRERQKHEYQQALVERYKHLPEVKRISRHRHLPTPIYKVMPFCLQQHESVSFEPSYTACINFSICGLASFQLKVVASMNAVPLAYQSFGEKSGAAFCLC